jgi:hypothetical protein
LERLTETSAEKAGELLLCEYALVRQYLALGFQCKLDGGSCFHAHDPKLREACPTKKLETMRNAKVRTK